MAEVFGTILGIAGIYLFYRIAKAIFSDKSNDGSDIDPENFRPPDDIDFY